MKYLLTTLCLASLATPAIAQDSLFTAPGGAVVQMNIETCPQNMICVDAFIKNGDANLSLMLPEWVDEPALNSRSEDLQAAAYFKGLSDGYVVDMCNDCKCCLISSQAPGKGAFMPWGTTPQALKMGSVLK